MGAGHAIWVLLLLAPAASLEIVCGANHNCVFERGTTDMKCWGLSDYDQLGYGDTNNRGDSANEMGSNLPFVHIGSGFLVEAMSLGGYHSCAMSVDRSRALKCFGRNEDSQLGFDGVTTTGDALPFLEFGVDFNVSKIAAGYYYTCALSTDAELKCFGDNYNGQCGAGTNDGEIIGPPSQISAIDLGTNFTPIDVDAFGYHTCVLSQQGTVKCFGRGYYGQLGYGDTADRGETPESMGDGLPIVDLGSNFIVAAIATGGYHTCALSTTKTVKCWGLNFYGQCGTPNSAETGDDLPVLEFGVDFVPMQLALGGYHTCILSETATLICFGYNYQGQLAIGSTIDLGSNFVARQVAAGLYHTCAVSTNDGIKCWGDNQFGQGGRGSNEMGDNLPFIDVAWPTASPSTASPSSKSPTTATPTTVAPSNIPTASPTTASPTTEPTIKRTTKQPTGMAQPLQSASPTTTVIIAACASALLVAVVCICAAAFCYVRKHNVREDRRLSENVADAQLEEEAQQAINEVGNDAEVRVPPPGVVAYARENAHVEDTRGEDNLSLPAQESVLCADARGRDNIELAISEVRVVRPGVVAHARENAHVEDTRGEDNLSLPAHDSVI